MLLLRTWSGVGNGINAKVKVDIPITLECGMNKSDLLSLTYDNFGIVKINAYEKWTSLFL